MKQRAVPDALLEIAFSMKSNFRAPLFTSFIINILNDTLRFWECLADFAAVEIILFSLFWETYRTVKSVFDNLNAAKSIAEATDVLGTMKKAAFAFYRCLEKTLFILA